MRNAYSVSEDAPATVNQNPLPQPQLVGGINFTTWPDLKWSRGRSHVATLESKLGEWHASAPVSVDAVLRADRQAIDLVARVPRGIPKHEWSLDLGDALHNLRSAFDAMAWGMAHFNDTKPAHPKSVTFPICYDEKQWEKAVKTWIGDIHPGFQERLRLMQPFTYAPEGGATVLSALHDLDIQDKHHDILTVSADLHGINLGGSFEYEDHDTHATPRIDMRSDIKFEDGIVLGTIHAGAPIRMLGQMFLRPSIKVLLTYKDAMHDVMPMLQQFIVETRRCLDILLFGVASPDSSEEGAWSPMDVGPPSV